MELLRFYLEKGLDKIKTIDPDNKEIPKIIANLNFTCLLQAIPSNKQFTGIKLIYLMCGLLLILFDIYNYLFSLVFLLIQVIIISVPILLSVAFITVLERKILAAFQKRKGPNVVGLFGLAQAFADAAKLLFKEAIKPELSEELAFFLAPLITFTISIGSWSIISFPGFSGIADSDYSFLYLLAFSSLEGYGVFIAGLSSMSRYPLLGAMRSTAQMISYEVFIGLILVNIFLVSGSLSITDIIYNQKDIYFIFPFFPLFIMFCISALAETNRTPFDLPEAEAELVAGYHVEYSSISFALFYIAEYSNIIFMSSVCTICFLGGWNPIFTVYIFPSFISLIIKVALFMFFFIWIRATFPRYRYDQLMQLGWKVFLPINLAYLLINMLFLF